MTSPLLTVPGAVAPFEGSADQGVPWHFGDPFAEQRSAARSVAVFDRSNRAVLAVSGDDRLTWLHSLTSQHFEALGEDRGSEMLVLDVQGRVEHHAVVANVGGVVYLDTEASTAGALLSYLTKMVFWSKVEPRDATAELAVLTVVGPELPELFTRSGVVLPERLGVVELPGGGFVRRMPWPGQDAADLVVPRGLLTDWWAKLTDAGARPAGSWAFEALRVESLRPRLGVDTDEKTIPHEVNWIGSAVHLDKGCYRGQETVSKVHNVGRPPRRMLLLHLDGTREVQPETGDPVVVGEKVVGRVGSVALHHELGTIALALVKRSVPVEAELLVGVDDRVVQASVDPDSVPPDTPGLGREAARNLGR
ncbi:glycine cleavage T C-terminal barrel domain-containing protein [Actinosynnema sp. NPDC047251]|uniref:Folate-binding protein n=1 Tax=Saccharothrix espanaensis (strain ATCC 51144 / DSM 44229 / JCM 9112 / NBRC 15066 / NRRL 15764) TaxID=1179773 RepID=K0KCY0_SACES|nr:glycine cleavage T C-terminal barrel domain-containing protein [Saccharothrix espanaensis]CCH35427.1 Folate-binding protein [Saccharothrix espanaensis DSM 44229]